MFFTLPAPTLCFFGCPILWLHRLAMQRWNCDPITLSLPMLYCTFPGRHNQLCARVAA